jgi:hypothetical protein
MTRESRGGKGGGGAEVENTKTSCGWFRTGLRLSGARQYSGYLPLHLGLILQQQELGLSSRVGRTPVIHTTDCHSNFIDKITSCTCIGS